jgi:hypothetical protein
MRNIKIANAQKRDAEVMFGGIIKKPSIYYSLPNGDKVRNIKILKSDLNHQYEALLRKFQNDEVLAQEMISNDPEINLETTGMIIQGSQKILVNHLLNPAYKVKVTEEIYLPDGTLKEEKPYISKNQNILGEFPISWTGRQIPISEAYNKFIFAKKYQLTHTNGLTFDFLFDMAKELFDKQVLMLIAGGSKGNEPLIFQENGKPYRAFLEGRIQGDAYLLLMHISNLELKSII